ncbi:hypothetical protein CYMTET_31252 [Cymbomonas tetramitiformis]|uniref:Amino acid transporter transmembrane domain-containing protein n=1 Tax=Cymbomonas tetramitiformis TaxID=36881 RepID=A0AAE0FHC2_9CHLO|nr:hypothetical protein CYMTET_31252 [Cymbomonas tetramitiformis]
MGANQQSSDTSPQPNFQPDLLSTGVNVPLVQGHTDSTGAHDDLNFDKRTVTYFGAYCTGINYIIGIGILTMPTVYVNAGIILSTGCLLLATLVSYLSVLWLLEAGARAEGLNSRSPHDNLPNNQISFRKYEVAELCSIFLSPQYGTSVYNGILSVYMVVCLWAFAAAAGNTGSRTICSFAGEDSDCSYYFPCLISYGCLTTVFTVRGLKEQVRYQQFLTCYRFFALIVIIGVSVYGLAASVNLNGEPVRTHFPATNWSAFSAVFSTSVFAQLLHHSVPGISQPVKNKLLLPRLFRYTLGTTFGLYTILSTSSALFFGEDLEDLVTLNFEEFNGFRKHGTQAPAWALILRYMVLLFPILDLCSLGPLAGITLSENILAAATENSLRSFGARNMRVASRLTVATLPVILAAFFDNITRIVNIAGTLGFFIAFTVPALLQVGSFKVCLSKNKSIQEPEVVFSLLGKPGNGPGLLSRALGDVALLADAKVCSRDELRGEAEILPLRALRDYFGTCIG